MLYILHICKLQAFTGKLKKDLNDRTFKSFLFQ